MTITEFPTRPAVLTIPERFDAHRIAELAEQILDARGDVLLDMSRVRFIDATGLRWLVKSRAEALARGHEVVVSGLSQAARIIFELAGLDEALPASPTMAEAA